MFLSLQEPLTHCKLPVQCHAAQDEGGYEPFTLEVVGMIFESPPEECERNGSWFALRTKCVATSHPYKLRSLDLSGNDLHITAAEVLIRTIFEHFPYLAVLNMSKNAINPLVSGLKYRDDEDCQIGAQDEVSAYIAMGSMMSYLRRMPHLTHLDMSDNQLAGTDPEGSESQQDFLQEWFHLSANSNILTIDLRSNKMPSSNNTTITYDHSDTQKEWVRLFHVDKFDGTEHDWFPIKQSENPKKKLLL